MSDPVEAWREPDLTPARARAVQRELAARVRPHGRVSGIVHVAGVDAAFVDGGRITRAAACVLGYPSQTPVETAVATVATRFPYVPGLLAFRELPAIMAVLEGLATPPDVILCDGHGLAHPRRCGLACHVGLATGIAALGVAKSRLVGRYQAPAHARGGWSWLVHRGERVGCVLRTRTGVRPVFVSPGHGIDHDRAREVALQCAPRYRLPEPIRCADRRAARG